MRAPVAELFLTILLLAGCLSANVEDQEGPSPDVYPGLRLLKAASAVEQETPISSSSPTLENAPSILPDRGHDPDPAPAPAPSADDVFFLPLEAAPDGRVAAFALPIPNGTALHEGDVVLEVAMIEEPDVDAWSLIIMDSRGSKASIETIYGAAGSRTPFYVHVDGAKWDDLILVAAVRGEGTADFAVQFLPSAPGHAAVTSDDFLQDITGDHWEVTALGEADGFGFDFFYQYHSLFLGPTHHRVQWGDVTVEEIPPTVASARPVSLFRVSAETEDRGFAAAVSSHTSWSDTGPVSGLSLARGVKESFSYIALPELTFGRALALGDGDGPSKAEVTMQTVGQPVLFGRHVSIIHIWTSTPLSELIGQPLATAGDSFSLRSLTSGERDLAFEAGGVRWVVMDVLPPDGLPEVPH